MIVFHEGLPGAGKSYEACSEHILPALKKGRTVITNIEGINHDKFSELSGLPVNVVRMLLVVIDNYHLDDEARVEADKKDLLEKTVKDSMVVLDEIQDMFPTGRQKLPVEWSKYIASHRHDGLDIILMGQHLGDVHTLWRRRCQRKIVFTKLSALGASSGYSWNAFEAISAEKFRKISTGVRRYDKQYFGLYKSVTSGTKNLDVYVDKRTNVFNTFGFKFGVPLVVAGLVWGLFHLVSFFDPNDEDSFVASVGGGAAVPASVPVAASALGPSSAVPSFPSKDDKPYEPDEALIDPFFFDVVNLRPRLTAVIFNGKKLMGFVEILDKTDHVRDRYSFEAIKRLGWSVKYTDAGLTVKKGEYERLIRPFPLDPWGKVDKRTSDSLDGSEPLSDQPVLKSSKEKAKIIPYTPFPRMSM